ncbi:MAG: helix-turn-helix domain-containing protein [Candidatus Dormibacteraceae bacterium]
MSQSSPAPIFTTKLKSSALRHQLRIRGLTGTDLAELAGISKATISHALNGHRILPCKVKAMVDALLEVKPISGIEHFIALDDAEEGGR